MRIRFHARWDLEYDKIFVKAFSSGVGNDTFDVEYDRPGLEGIWERFDDADVGIVIGVKGTCGAVVESYRRRGAVGMMIDKGYIRQSPDNYWSLNLNSMRPTAYAFLEDKPGDRLAKLNFTLCPLRKNGNQVVIFALSPKGFRCYDGGIPIDRLPTREEIERCIQRQLSYFQSASDVLLKYTQRPLFYRPRGAKEVDRFEHLQVTRIDPFKESIQESLAGAWCAVCHTSNAGVNALLAGIPVIELGSGVTAPVSSTSLGDVERCKVPTEGERQRWLRQLSYVQWTVAEIASGEAWRHMRPVVESLRAKS